MSNLRANYGLPDRGVDEMASIHMYYEWENNINRHVSPPPREPYVQTPQNAPWWPKWHEPTKKEIATAKRLGQRIRPREDYL